MQPRLMLAAFASLAACTTFGSIDRNVCGNGLLEPGEDCDSTAATCVACAVTCSVATDCPNAGYACGVDHVCHAPSGVLAPATAPSLFLVDDFRVTDIDADGIGDVIGSSKTSLEVRFGDVHAALTSQFTTLTPSEITPAAFADLDGDGSIDAAFGSPDGIVAYESPFGAPSPAVSFQPLVLGSKVPDFRSLSAVLPDTTLGFVADANGLIQVWAIQFTDTLPVTINPLCGITAADFSADNIDVYVVTQNASASTTVDVVLSELTTGTPRRLCVQALHLDVEDASTHVRPATFTTLAAVGAVPAHKPIWANLDLDADPCPSLVDSDAGGAALTAWTGATVPAGANPAHCGIGAVKSLPAMPSDVPSDAVAVGRVLISPSVPFIAGDALVMTSGVYVFTLNKSLQTVFSELYPSATKLARVAIGDFNGDGNMDAVLSNEHDSGLYVLFRDNGSLFPGLIIESVPTNGAVTALGVGDFDGNHTDDIAYAEALLDHDALTIDYGLPGNTFVSNAAGTFASVRSVAAVHVADVNDPFAVAASAFVLAGLASSPQLALTVLVGGPQRTMVSYFDPRQAADPSNGEPIRGIAGGHFSSTPTPPFLDLVTFVSQTGVSLNGVGGTAPFVAAYRLDGTANGLDPSMDPVDTGGGAQLAGVQDCTNSVPSTSYPCINDALLLPWTIAQDHDVLVGVDRQTSKAFSFDPSTLKARTTTTVADASGLTSASIVPTGAIVQSSHAVDMNADGTSELVLSFAPPAAGAASGSGAVEVCPISSGTNAITVGTCSPITSAVAAVAPGVTCVDAARGHFAATGPTTTPGVGDELVVLCHDPATADSLVARVSYDGSAYHAVVIASGLGPLRAIQVGDVTGDGVDDIVAIRGDAGARSVTVLVQCDSRDLACQQTGVAP